MSEELFKDWKIFPITSENAGNLKANGSVTMCGTASVKFKILARKDGGLFAAFPSEKYTDKKDGTEKYSQAVFLLDEATRELFQTQAVAAFNNPDMKSTGPAPSKSTKQIPF